MRLLFFTSIFPNPYEPTKGAFNRELARALSVTNDLRVVSPLAWTDERKGRKRHGRLVGDVGVAEVGGAEVTYPRYFYTPGFGRRWYGSFMWRSVKNTLLPMVKGGGVDAVLSYWAHPDGEVATRAARIAGVPSVVMVGGTDVLLFTKSPGRRRCIVNVLQSADAVVAVSRDLREKVCELGVAAQKVHVVERGVDLSLFHPGDRAESRRRAGIVMGGPVVVWVGRMHPVKGLDVLVEACDVLRRQGLEFTTYLVGDGPLRKELEADVAARGLGPVVRFVGVKGKADLPDWYRAADVMVLPSRSEGIPNVLRESLACGTPFVASRVGGIPELDDGVSAWLVPPGDPVALAEALDQAIESRRRGGAISASSGTWLQSAEALVSVLAPLVMKGRRAAGSTTIEQGYASSGAN